MAPNQKTWLVNKSSKLGKIDNLADILRKDEAWALLPPEERQKLYDMLPPPREGEPQHDIDVNPMQTMYRPYIEAEPHVFIPTIVPANIFDSTKSQLRGNFNHERRSELSHPDNMAPAALQHRRTHNLLLISKLLNQRDAASPFTLVLDSLEQSGKALVAEYIRRANASKVQVIFVSFETLRKPRGADVFIEAWKQKLSAWQRDVVQCLKNEPSQKNFLIVDTLNPLSSTHSSTLPALLSSFIGPSTSLLALYHTDVPTFSAPSGPSGPSGSENPYSPTPLTLLCYLATTIFTTHSLHHILAKKAARERSHAEPSFGLETGIEGILQSFGANGGEGVVLEMEHRRKSGRGVREWYFLPRHQAAVTSSSQTLRPKETVILLEDHPQYRTPEESSAAAGGDGEADTTFELGLTEKQRRDREGPSNMSDRFGRRDDRRQPRDDTRNHRPRYEQDRSRSPRGRNDRRDDRRRDRSPPRNAPNSRNGPPPRDNRDRDFQRNGPPRGPGGRPDIKREPDPKANIQKESKPDVNMMDMLEDEAEEAAMQRIMGFKDFRTTKNTKVPGNERNYAVHKVKKVEYRQYMNRVGGFNRPLSPSRV
ncbi:Elongator complex protein 5 [Fulvia fulva]|uniref:Elongator complex protein 5 n=1 Tax=Passalora fulva TaxID=5499 RepID=A0A9Q8L9A0_PASFU|nr:Elongator complex protein 5 [Fulvia fulva]KAK4631575.1 Elongator complex protein 5 [Fulvia fulva]KAK4632837.1 Elongator complex protein 5 [Fulvia fulva]UJO13296.1 Elongator complex protein 5 [Fulvia fulva]WPV11087.1 Elongator complex protein 5 [Fulvia fulva]WPV26867.1 Elongator complex protein 5 [Fulvia fulva]